MGKSYSEMERRTAVAAYVIAGTYAGASKSTGIPYTTIQSWHDKNPSWWESVAAEVRDREEDRIQAGYRKAVDDGMAQIFDRIEHGDVKVNSRGERYRVPVSCRDLVVTVGVCQDKLNLSMGKPTSIDSTQRQVTTKDKLERLKAAVTGVDADNVVQIEG